MLENGKKVLNTRNSNYSFGSLERVFRLAMEHFPPRVDYPGTPKVLILGFGGGSIVHILRQKYGFSGSITGVDFDPQLIAFARQHFPESFEDVELVIADAAEYIHSHQHQYDLVFVDLFINDQTLPKVLHTPFLQDLARIITSHGRIYHNVMIRNSRKLLLFRQTYEKLFDEVKVLQLLGANQVVVAFNSTAIPAEDKG